MDPQITRKLVILAVLDGWGIAPPSPGNAITLGNTPNLDSYWSTYPHAQLRAAGQSVGLPKGEDGNSETGHINMGAGRIVYQYLARINMSIADGSFYKNETLIKAVEHVNKNNSKLHLMGLIGSGGVHSNIEHLFAIIQFAKQAGVKDVLIHAFTDGRDSPPKAAVDYIGMLEQTMQNEGVGKIATLMGRYWSMDRDGRWDRTAKAYNALTKGTGFSYTSAQEAIKSAYANGASDEFIEPSIIVGQDNKPLGIISDNDAVVFFNFRIDRPRQLARAFVFYDFDVKKDIASFDPHKDQYQSIDESIKLKVDFKRGKRLENLFFATMTEYERPLVEAGAMPIFAPEVINMPLGRVISLYDMRQIRVAESEKERFVTYYFNGRRENPFPGEERFIVPSPNVKTYDQKPEMSAYLITDALLAKLKEGDFAFAMINYANADMVGHTGNLAATARAAAVVDECIGKVYKYIINHGGTLIITADHGNAEELINSQTNEIDTEHSDNPVPFIAISQNFSTKPQMLPLGKLADIAPSILALYNIKPPGDMMGVNLLEGLIEDN